MGRFITFEGGEGAGKTTQIGLLAEALRARGLTVLVTREPGGAPGAEVLRQILLGGVHDWSPEAETLLHFAARAEHVARTIRPALARGEWVLCDRFYDSTLAYQGYGQGANLDTIRTLIAMVGVRPDLTLMLEVSAETSRTRLVLRGAKADRYESLGVSFHQRVEKGFAEIAAAEPERCERIAADGNVETVAEAILNATTKRLLK